MESRDGRVVDVTEEESMHGSVPVTGELVPGGAVPPVRVEAAVREEGKFSENVELESGVS